MYTASFLKILIRGWIIALTALAFALTLEASFQTLSTLVSHSWSKHDQLPSMGAVGPHTLNPLLKTAQIWSTQSQDRPIFIVGDSILQNQLGYNWSELPPELTFSSNLKEYTNRPIINLATWSADWSMHALLLPHLLAIQKATNKPGDLVINLTGDILKPTPYITLFSQFCSHPICDLQCKNLCNHDPRYKKGFTYAIAQKLPNFFNSFAGLASFSQTFFSSGPLSEQPVYAREHLGLMRLLPEFILTPYFEKNYKLFIENDFRKHTQKNSTFTITQSPSDKLKKLSDFENTWYQWLLVLSESLKLWNGKVIILGVLPGKHILDKLDPLKTQDIVNRYTNMRSIVMSATPKAQWINVNEVLDPTLDYSDAVHWTVRGAAKMAARVNQEFRP